MSSYGFLQTASHTTPTTVQLEIDGDALVLTSSGAINVIPLRELRKLSEAQGQLQIGRRGKRNWKLTVSGPLAQQLGPSLTKTRAIRWGAARAWHAGIFVATILAVELVKIPSEWLAPVLPAVLERRLIAQDLRGYYGSYCTSPDGERAIRRLIARFDPEVERRVHIEVLSDAGFVITAAPSDRLIISNAFLAGTSGDELAALLAHQVAHLQRHDEVRAALRANGTLGSLIGTITGASRPDYSLDFSSDEEWSADSRAMNLLSRAHISTLPGAALFERIEQERQANRSFGKEQYYLHYGMGSERAERWRDAEDKGLLLQSHPAFTRDEEDAVFNYCWKHTGPPRHPLPVSAAPVRGKDT